MKKLLKIGFYTVFLGYTLFFMLCLYAYIKPLPILGQSERLKIVDINDEIIYESNFEKKSTWIDYDNIPLKIINSFICVEDRRFYQHFGFDPIRITKSLLVNLLSGSIEQGGSTITQQYARNLFLNQSLTLSRKITEVIYAIQIEMHYNKEQIMEGYLNTIYFGHGIYGIGNAANFFFNKSLYDLNDLEIATLVGICNAPSYYSPFLNYDNSLIKAHQILYTMYEQGVISHTDYLAAIDIPLTLNEYNVEKDNSILSSFYKDSVLGILDEMNLLSDTALKNGLIVKTYYNPNVQKQLQKAIDANTKNVTDIQTSGVIIEPFSGNVLAIAGSTNYELSQFNRSLYAKRQIGSTIKPLLYYLALEQGFNPSTSFLSQPTTFQLSSLESYTPTNYNYLYPYDYIPLVHALSVSDNIYAVKTHLFLGTDTLSNTLLSLGFNQTKDITALALGCVDMSVLELARIYNTFASEGLYVTPAFIQSVTDLNGNTLYERVSSPKRIFNRDTTLILNQLLRSPFDIKNQGYTTPSLLSVEPLVITGAKSGTSDWDSWIAGFNPDYTIVVWNGYDDATPLTTTKERRVSRLIWRDTFNLLYSNAKDGGWYKPSDDLVEIRINPKTGLYDPNGSLYWYKKNNVDGVYEEP